MKKFFFLAVAAVVALAACTKNEADTTAYEQSRVINFTAVTGKATKAPITTTYYPDDIPFGVYCYAVKTGNWDAKYNTDDAQLYMDNEQISYNETVDANGIYAPSTTYYWPLSGSLTFIGYSPYMASGVSYAKATRTLTITNFTQEDDIDDQVDLMWATTNPDQTNNGSDHYKSESGDAQSTNTGVNIVFHHALSQVKFNVKKAAGLDAYTITVNSITFDAYSKGTLTVTNDSPAWSAQAKQDAFVYNTTGSNVVAPNNSAEFAAFGVANMPVPQELATGVQTFTITYSLAKGGVDLGQKTVTQDLLGATVDEWEKNTIYNYNIVIDLKKIYFNPTIIPWDEAASAQVINVPNA